MAASKVKTALLGAGYIAKWHADVLARMPGVSIDAVCDVSESAATQLARQYGAPRVFTSLDDMLAAGGVDCVHVMTPPQHHAGAVDALLDAGVAAFVEKPFVLSAADAERLAAKSSASRTLLGVNHNFLMLPSYDRLKRDIGNGVIGPIDTMNARWQFPLPPLRSGPYGLWMLREPKNLLFEIGPHLFAFVADLLGDLDDLSVDLRHPITLPSGVRHFQSWRVAGMAGNACATLDMSLIEGHDDRSVSVRGLGAGARYDFAQDAYRLDRAAMGDIVVGPLAAQLDLAGQALACGFGNAARQVASLNRLAPYGLSFERAIAAFYRALRSEEKLDRRLSADLAANTISIIERAIHVVADRLATDDQTASAPSLSAETGETALVIGGTGFIGRALTRQLAESGFRVHVFTRGSGAGVDRLGGRVEIVSGDLKSQDDLARAMAGVDVVYHLARADEKTWEGYLENDVAVTRGIGEACLKAGVKRLIYTGTIDSYDASRPDRPITEETPFDHDLTRRNLYARSKAACEAALLDLQQRNGLRLAIARPGIVIGPGGPLQHWGIAMWRGATACKLWGRGDNIMPFVLVDDVAGGLVRMARKEGIDGQSFNLIGEPMLSARDYFAAVSAANGVAIRAKSTPIGSYFMIDVAKYWAKRLLARKTGLTKPSFRDWQSRAQLSPFENERAKALLDWRPETDRTAFIRRGVEEARLFGL